MESYCRSATRGWAACIWLLPLLAAALAGPAWAEEAKPAPAEEPLFTFAQITDTHVIAGKSVDALRKGIRDIAFLEPRPKFVVGTGDLIDGTQPEESTKLLQATLADLPCRFYAVFGNHDNREWHKKLLADYNYAFDIAPYHFIALDSIEMGAAEARDTYGARFSDATVQWLREHLKSVDPKTPLILFTHASIYREKAYSKALPGDVHNYEPILEMLKPYRAVAWLGGHAHYNCVIRKENIDYITTGCLSDHRKNANAPLGYRIVKVYPGRVETVYRSIEEFRTPVVVAQDGSGDLNGMDDQPIREAIARAAKQGGTVLIQPGEYLVRRQIQLPSGITLAGTPKTVLRLPSPVLTMAAVPQDGRALPVANTAQYAADTQVQICPPGKAKAFPGQTVEKVKATIQGVEEGRLLLAEPLPFALPEGCRVGYAHNVFFVGGSNRDITLRGLTIDGGLVKDIEMPAHTERCALLAHGIWSYAKGPTAPPIENLRVEGCRIRNCYGRAVAMYSVVRGRVEGCLVENIADEAVDLDHFCTHCVVRDNEIRGGATGVTLNDASHCIVENNRIAGCGVGITMWWWHQCPMPGLNVENRIAGNVITSPKGAAISLGKRCFRNEVTGNTVEGAIKVEETDNNVHGNTTRE